METGNKLNFNDFTGDRILWLCLVVQPVSHQANCMHSLREHNEKIKLTKRKYILCRKSFMGFAESQKNKKKNLCVNLGLKGEIDLDLRYFCAAQFKWDACLGRPGRLPMWLYHTTIKLVFVVHTLLLRRSNNIQIFKEKNHRVCHCMRSFTFFLCQPINCIGQPISK